MAATTPSFRRYALYFVPEHSAFAAFGASWLGWDIVTGQTEPHPQIPNLPLDISEITETPRRYGLHGTIVPPFRFKSNHCFTDVVQDIASECEKLAPAPLAGLELVQLGRFLALVPMGDTAALGTLAAKVLQACDPFRAPLSTADLERHRAKGLSDQQDALLMRWGYPYVMEAFRFHITLTGKLSKTQARLTYEVLSPLLTPLLDGALVIDRLALVGEDDAGSFHLISQFPLKGAAA